VAWHVPASLAEILRRYILSVLSSIIHHKDVWMLEFPGLDQTAAAVYRALLAAGDGPADLSVVTGLPDGDIRAALGTLVGLNLVRPPAGTSGGWSPLRPELEFAAQARRYEAGLAQMTHQLAVLRTAATAAALAATAAGSARLRHTAGPIEPLETCRDALAEASRLAAGATAECLQVMPAGPEPLAVLHSDLSRYEVAVGRGVRVRALYHDSARGNAAALAHARRAARSGAEVRFAPILPPPLLICDRQVALIPAAEDRHETALCVREPSIVTVLCAVFDNGWDTAMPLGTRITPDETAGLTTGERALLRLLAAGFTDETAASRLGVSLRTVRRQVNGLMTRLQADSRFQAGLNAGQRGWL
jgi:DNA-binding CsgD family transcriptional regulator